MNLPLDTLRRLAAAQPYPLLFATVSGAHLYGFPSPDSDFDLRGVPILPARDMLGRDAGRLMCRALLRTPARSAARPPS